jgi:hypothetical protein
MGYKTTFFDLTQDTTARQYTAEGLDARRHYARPHHFPTKTGKSSKDRHHCAFLVVLIVAQ